MKSVEIFERYDNLFVGQDSGWLGADAAHSIILSEDRVLWLFGDTFLGKTIAGVRYPEGYHINNCLAIQDLTQPDSANITYFWGDSVSNTRAFFPPQPGLPGQYYWPTNGLIVNDQLLIFCFAMAANEQTWWIDGTVVIKIVNYQDDPYDWICQYNDMKIGNNNTVLHSAIFLENEHLYFLGFADRENKREAILARTPVNEFIKVPTADSFEYWVNTANQKSWNRKLEHPVILFTPGITETNIQYDQAWDMYFITVYDPMQADIFLTVANNLEGPWEKPVQLFTNPDHVTMTYAARLHPHLSTRSGELIISYVTAPGSLDLSKESMDTYRPRFLKLELEKTKYKQ
ncbi:MAG: DUF4185 domain-containing protein [Candidatus Marinimicrobia bacterium]|nr:DUF4185 domain-containing protein [Candidatus Neomarinimicrobiota bacterium]